MTDPHPSPASPSAVPDPSEPPTYVRPKRRRWPWIVGGLVVLVGVVSVAVTATAMVLEDDDDPPAAPDHGREAICADARLMVSLMRGAPTGPRWAREIGELAQDAERAGDAELFIPLVDWGTAHQAGDYVRAGDATRDVAAICEGEA